MPDTIAYTARSVSTGAGRDGHVRTPDGRVDLNMAAPKEMGGTGDGSNPEQLFASGYAACFHSAIQLVARRSQVPISGSTVTADVGIGPEGDGFGLTVALTVSLPGVPADQATRLLDAAHQVCPYSRATRGNIPVELTVA